jgi:hypothetical protein
LNPVSASFAALRFSPIETFTFLADLALVENVLEEPILAANFRK